MAGFYTFDPTMGVKRGDYDFVALGARATDAGLLVDVQVLNGSPKWRDAVLLSDETPRHAAVMRIVPLTTLTTPVVADALLELGALSEGALRKAMIIPEWQEPAPFWRVEPPPFPLTALPVPILQRFVQEVSAAFQTPHDFAAMGVVSALSGAIGNRRRIHIVGEIFQGACLWISIIGRPGTGKSDPVEKALEPISNLHEANIKAYLEEKDAYELELTAWENLKKEDRSDKPQPPTPKRLMVADHTMEGLALDLANNPLGMVLYRDELATWLAGFDKYRAAGGGSDRANWLEIWRSRAIDVSRKTGTRVVYVTRPFVTVIGTIQPNRLQELLGNMDDGFSDRLLCVYPISTVSPLPMHGINPSTMKAYREVIETILEQEPGEDGKALVVELSKPALARFRERARGLDDALRDDSLAAGIAGCFAKLRIYASRFTLLMHQAAAAAGNAEPLRADIEHVEAAWDLVDYLQGHARLVHAAKLSDPEAQRASHVLDLLARKGWASFTRRQVYMWLPTRFVRPDDADAALKLLCDHGFVRERPMPERTGRGRPPSQVYDVNPLWKPAVGSHNSQIHINTDTEPAGDWPGFTDDDEQF